MFRFHKPRDLITLFHNPSSPISVRAQTLLKSLNASSDPTAEHSPSSKPNQAPSPGSSATAGRSAASTAPGQEVVHAEPVADFELEVVTGSPTAEQVKTVWEYLKGQPGMEGKGVGELVKGAREVGEVGRVLEKGGAGAFVRPVVVDWGNGRVVLGGDEGELVRLVKGLKEGK